MKREQLKKLYTESKKKAKITSILLGLLKESCKAF